MSLDAVLAKIDETLPQSLDRLLELLRIPSISTDPAFKGDCAKAADWLAEDLKGLGFEASSRPTPGHPMVVAHFDGPGPHVLFYGHYDVLVSYTHLDVYKRQGLCTCERGPDQAARRGE